MRAEIVLLSILLVCIALTLSACTPQRIAEVDAHSKDVLITFTTPQPEQPKMINTFSTLERAQIINPYFSVQNSTDELFRVDHEGNFYLYPLTNCDTLDTDGSGLLSCGTDADCSVDGSCPNIAYDSEINKTYVDESCADIYVNETGEDAIYVADRIIHQGDTDTYILFNLDRLSLIAGETNFIEMIETGANDQLIFNNDGDTMEIIFKTSSEPSMLFINGSSNMIGVRKNPIYTFDVNGTIGGDCFIGQLNGTWNESINFAPVNYGDGWNKTYADTLYTNNTDTDTNLTEDNVEAYIFDSDNTANLDMNNYNITVNTIVMEEDQANHWIYDNATCIVIKAGTTYLEVCE